MAISPNDVLQTKAEEIKSLRLEQMKYVKHQERVIDDWLRSAFGKPGSPNSSTTALSGWESRSTLEILRDRYRHAGWTVQLDYDEVDRSIRLHFTLPSPSVPG